MADTIYCFTMRNTPIYLAIASYKSDGVGDLLMRNVVEGDVVIFDPKQRMFVRTHAKIALRGPFEVVEEVNEKDFIKQYDAVTGNIPETVN
jgi:hypothetical protein